MRRFVWVEIGTPSLLNQPVGLPWRSTISFDFQPTRKKEIVKNMVNGIKIFLVPLALNSPSKKRNCFLLGMLFEYGKNIEVCDEDILSGFDSKWRS